MKCNYCNTELKQGAKFCPNCGKEVLEYEVCISCGEKIKIGAQFCPHCGANQAETIEPIQQSNTSVEEQPPQKDDVPIQNEEVPTANESRDEHVKTQQLDDTVEVQNNSSKKWLLIIPLIILIVGAVVWYFYSNGFSFGEKADSSAIKAEAVDSTMIETDIQSVDGITSRLYEIYINGFKLQDDEAVNKYFSEEFRALYKKVDEIDNNSGEMGFWEGNIWDGGQDGNPTDVEIMRVDKSSPTVALADVKLSYHNGDYHSNQKLSMTLVFENGNWFIDENNEMRFKERMKEYVNENANSNDSPTSFVNKIYKGSGNGGGIGTKMTISFLDNNKCLCESDWYQAFSSPKTYQGTYSIDGDKLLVRCKVDDTEYEFKFDVKSNGRVIEFNNSDPDVGGTMGNDIMSLELQ